MASCVPLHELYPGRPMLPQYDGTRSNVLPPLHRYRCVAKHLLKAHQQTEAAYARENEHARASGSPKVLHHPAVAPDDVVDDPDLAFVHTDHTGHTERAEHHEHPSHARVGHASGIAHTHGCTCRMCATKHRCGCGCDVCIAKRALIYPSHCGCGCTHGHGEDISGCACGARVAFPAHGYEGFEAEEPASKSHMREYAMIASVIFLIIAVIWYAAMYGDIRY